MSTPDSLTSLTTEPWTGAGRTPLPITPLPGVTANAIEGLKASFPGALSRDLQELLARTCGLEGTALGSLDFTGQWHAQEPLAVFRPCLTLAIDDQGRRWIAEGAEGDGLPGPVWCILPKPQVALYVCDGLAQFLSELRGKTAAGDLENWLKALSLEARVVWKHRTSLGVRPGGVSDPAIRNWVATLPPDAYVYDLRTPGLVRGWPYGVAGPTGRYHRCGRSPVFAVSGPPAADRWSRHLPVAPLQPQELRRCA